VSRDPWNETTRTGYSVHRSHIVPMIGLI